MEGLQRDETVQSRREFVGYIGILQSTALISQCFDIGAAYRSVTRPRESQVIPVQSLHGLTSLAHPSPPSPLPFPVARYTSIKAQNCSAAPTPVAFTLENGVEKSFVADARTGVQSEHG